MPEVLLVEDDFAIGENLVELLESEGYHVEWGHDGVEGLDLLHRTHPDVILLDILMPRMNGFQFRSAQKSDPSIADVPVIVISAHARAHEVDADEFLDKPFDVAALLSAVARHGGRVEH